MRPGSTRDVPAQAEPLELPSAQPETFELSVVVPCLNEADTLGACIDAILETVEASGISTEVIIADNGSTDGSVGIAREKGVRVVPVAEKGYGNALMGGIAAARGRYVIMGDADGSYDFRQIPRFVEKLRGGYELVQGCRLASGGGRVLPGAMPFLHRWLGNPLFSFLARLWFRTPVHDVYCGLRGFVRELPDRLSQQCPGMEFATEMIVKASLTGVRIAEVPITLHPDGRVSHEPHLRTFQDGWRTLRFYLMYSPRWLFLWPALALIGFGLVTYAVALPGVRIAGARLDVHTLLFGSLAIILGSQAIVFFLSARTYGASHRYLPTTSWLERIQATITLERGLVAGAVLVAGGVALLAAAVLQWSSVGFGDLDYARTMRWVIPGATLTTVGFQVVLGSFLLGMLGFERT